MQRVAFSNRVIVCLLLAITVVRPAGAEPQSEELLFAEPVVSAAVKRLQPAREAPTAVTVISREELRRFGYRTLAEALRSVAGFYSTNDRSYTYLGVRGLQRPGDFSDRVLLLINGHSLNDDVYQHAPVGEDFGLDLEAIDRIEVIRGPGAALYGGNALFAVINVVTLAGSDAPGPYAQVETGSYVRKRGRASYGLTRGGLDIYGSASVLDVDGHRDLYYGDYDLPAFNHGLAEDADAERALRFFARARYHGWSLQADASGREKRIPTAPYGSAFDDNDSKTFDQRGFVELEYEGELWRDVAVDARVYYDYLRTHATLVYGSDEDRIKNETRARSDWFGTELRASKALFDRDTLTAGVEVSHHPNARPRNYDRPGGAEYLDRTRTFTNLGVYVQNELRPFATLTLITGARFDSQYDRIQQWSPRLAAVWRPLDRTVLKLLYGTAFRAPNLFESYRTIQQSSFHALDNPGLDEEHITTYEAAIEQGLWTIGQLAVAVFHDEIDDLVGQVSGSDPAGVPTTQYRNSDSTVRATGVEISARVALPKHIGMRAAYSLQVSRLPGDRRLSNSPQHLASLGLLVPLPFGVEAASELLVMGARDTLGGDRLATVVLWNANLVYSVPGYPIDLSIGLYNLLDRSYGDPAGPEYLQDRIAQDPFTFRAQVGYGF